MRSNQSILKEINLEYSLEGLMLKLQYFGYLMRRADSLMLGKIEGRRRRGQQRTRHLDGISDSMDMSLSKLQRWWRTGKHGVLQSTGLQRVRHNSLTELLGNEARYIWICCCSVAQSGPTLCDPMDCSTLGFPVLHHLPELAQTHVHWVSDAIQPSHPLSSPSPALILSHLLMKRRFASSDQSTGASVWALVLPMNIQDWFLLGLTGLINFQSKGLSIVFSHIYE